MNRAELERLIVDKENLFKVCGLMLLHGKFHGQLVAKCVDLIKCRNVGIFYEELVKFLLSDVTKESSLRRFVLDLAAGAHGGELFKMLVEDSGGLHEVSEVDLSIKDPMISRVEPIFNPARQLKDKDSFTNFYWDKFEIDISRNRGQVVNHPGTLSSPISLFVCDIELGPENMGREGSHISEAEKRRIGLVIEHAETVPFITRIVIAMRKSGFPIEYSDGLDPQGVSRLWHARKPRPPYGMFLSGELFRPETSFWRKDNFAVRNVGTTVFEELLAQFYYEYKNNEETFPRVDEDGKPMAVICSASKDLETQKLVRVFSGYDGIEVSLMSLEEAAETRPYIRLVSTP